jgi:hypothetical protein
MFFDGSAAREAFVPIVLRRGGIIGGLRSEILPMNHDPAYTVVCKP